MKKQFVVATALCALSAQAQNAPKMKMTTDIPPQITTPDSVETRLGTLRFFDGFPDDATVEKVYNNQSNWIQTVPGKGWFTILRLYGALEPWFDQTWRPGEIELVKGGSPSNEKGTLP